MADAPPSLLGRLRQLGDTGLELAQVRLALLGTDLEEQKLRLGQGLLLAAAGVLLLVVGVVLLCALVLLLAGPQYRLAALVVLTLLSVGAGAALVRAGLQRLRSPGSPFQATLDELQRDREALGGSPRA